MSSPNMTGSMFLISKLSRDWMLKITLNRWTYRPTVELRLKFTMFTIKCFSPERIGRTEILVRKNLQSAQRKSV